MNFMRHFFRLAMLACFAAGLAAVAGCGDSSNRSPLGKIVGTVKYRGKPVSGTLIFETSGARSAYGKIVDGRITEVTTYADGDGAPLGLARIAVFVAPPENPAGTAQEQDVFRSMIPAKYNDPATSGLTLQVVAGENTLALDLQ
jgi:hypothetical protein